MAVAGMNLENNNNTTIEQFIPFYISWDRVYKWGRIDSGSDLDI